MTRGEPTAHIFKDGEGGIVTKTHDIELARKLMREELAKLYLPEELEDSGYDFTDREPVLEFGRVVPADRNQREDGYEWFWYWQPESEYGKPGVTRAVGWHL